MDYMINLIPKKTFDIFSRIMIMRYFYVSFTIFFLYNIPIILTYRLLLSKSNSSNFSSFIGNFFNIFYKSPMYIILYFYTNSSLKKFINEINPNNTNPEHYFQSIVVNTQFMFLYPLYYLLPYPLYWIPSTLINSIYISQLSYKFIDSDKYTFNNSIDYCNSNLSLFLLLGGIFTIIESRYLLIYNIEILGLFLYMLFIFPLLTIYPYVKKEQTTNIFYVAEFIINFILRFF